MNMREITKETTTEEVIAQYFDEASLVLPKERLFRLDHGGYRLYYKYDKKGDPKFFISITTLIRQTTPTSPHLIKWIADKGYDEAKEFTSERADYGTFMHAEIARLLIDGSLNLDSMQERLAEYIQFEGLPETFIYHVDELQKDLLAFAQFVIDHKVKPYAIEIALANEDEGYAMTIDLPCKMTIKVDGKDPNDPYKSGKRKGEPRDVKIDKEITAIIDFKSGRKGFYMDHIIQLEGCLRTWNKHFPDKPIEKIYNWAPKEWRGKTPTYHLKDQTDEPDRAQLDHLVQIAKIKDSQRERTITITKGMIDLSREDLSDNIDFMTFEELIKQENAKTNK